VPPYLELWPPLWPPQTPSPRTAPGLHWLRTVPERIRSKVAVLVYTKSSTAVHRRTLARSLITLPTFKIADSISLPVATASFSFRFTTPLLAAEQFRLLTLSLRCGIACPRGYVGTVSGDLPHSTQDVPVCCIIHILTFNSFDIFLTSAHCL